MSDDRQRFEEYLAKFEGCYQSIEVGVIETKLNTGIRCHTLSCGYPAKKD